MAQNPFRIRASEQATQDEQFLSLVGPHVLDLLPSDQLWDRLIIIESAPGAGKTTILRLFTPVSLNSLGRLREQDAYRPLFDRLRNIGALANKGPMVAGVLINCREQYATIQDLPIDKPKQLRWFFGLLDARITLLTLRSILRLRGQRFPDEVRRIQVRPNERATVFPEGMIDGLELYNRARDAERILSHSLNSLVGIGNVSKYLLNGLHTLRLLSTSDLSFDGIPVQERPLLMFDDVHELARTQREALRRDLENRDLAVARWLAQRSQALEPAELLSSARTEGRDFEHVHFEEWAQGSRKTGKRFYDLLDEIGNRRAQKSQADIESLDTCLMTELTNRERRQASVTRDSTRDSAGSWASRASPAVGSSAAKSTTSA